MLEPELDVDPVNRRLRGGVLHATMSDGSARDLTVDGAVGNRAFTSVPGCTSDSTATGTASGAGRSTSTANTSRTARRTTKRAACINSATASSGSTIRSAVVSVSATCRASSPVPHPDLGLDEQSSFM